ncbi:MAG: hypothetical protein ACD_68C00032G0004, partial [uncultured bacterium]
MKKTVIFVSLLVIILLIAFFLISQKDVRHNSDSSSEKPRVLASFLPMAIFTQNVAGNYADVDILIPPGASAHDYSFSPSDLQKINSADALIINGAGFEDWLTETLASSDRQDLEIIDTSSSIELINEGRDETAADPHLWISPKNAIKQVNNIAEGLAKIDSVNAENYRLNAAEYIARLKTLDEEITTHLQKIKSKQFVAFHSAFTYFTRDYGLEQVAAIEEFPGKEPSAAYIAEVENKIKDLGIKAIFSEPQFSPRIVDALASDLNLTVLTLDPLETGFLENDYYE